MNLIKRGKTEGNLKLGQHSSYPNYNQNLERLPRNFISRRAFIRILKKYFPEYVVDPNLDYVGGDVELKYYIGGIGLIHTLKNNEIFYEPIVVNKGYVCFKEATPEESGTVLYLHDGVVLVFKERYQEANLT